MSPRLPLLGLLLAVAPLGCVDIDEDGLAGPAPAPRRFRRLRGQRRLRLRDSGGAPGSRGAERAQGAGPRGPRPRALRSGSPHRLAAAQSRRPRRLRGPARQARFVRHRAGAPRAVRPHRVRPARRGEQHAGRRLHRFPRPVHRPRHDAGRRRGGEGPPRREPVARGWVPVEERVAPPLRRHEQRIVRDMDMLREALGDDKLTYLGSRMAPSSARSTPTPYPTECARWCSTARWNPSLTNEQFIEGPALAFEQSSWRCSRGASKTWSVLWARTATRLSAPGRPMTRSRRLSKRPLCRPAQGESHRRSGRPRL